MRLKMTIMLMMVGILCLTTACSEMNTNSKEYNLLREKVEERILKDESNVLATEEVPGHIIMAYENGNRYGFSCYYLSDEFIENQLTLMDKQRRSSYYEGDEFQKVKYWQLQLEDVVYVGVFLLDEEMSTAASNVELQFENAKENEVAKMSQSLYGRKAIIMKYDSKIIREIDKVIVITSEGKEIYLWDDSESRLLNEIVEIEDEEIEGMTIRLEDGLYETQEPAEVVEFLNKVRELPYEKVESSTVENLASTGVIKREETFDVTVYHENGSEKFFVTKDYIYLFYEVDAVYKAINPAKSLLAELNEELSTLEYEEGLLMKKPVIYLYPEEPTDIKVGLDIRGFLTTTYPKYENGWNVKAYPDGTIENHDGRKYSYLYWEGQTDYDFNIDKGFVISGDETAEFLYNKLYQMGLNYKESNDFITYWLPEMEANDYNLIHFSTEEYEEIAKLNVKPTPDNLIRIFMVYKPLDEFIEIPEQEIEPFNRDGFTVVEWGGCCVEE